MRDDPSLREPPVAVGGRADLRSWTLLELQHHFGSFGTRLHDLCRGIDNRDVSSSRERKSVSVEETYTPDVPDLQACLALLPELLENLQARIARCGAQKNVAKLFVKLKFANFTQTTVECVGRAPAIAQLEKLMETGFARGNQPVRLLGVGVRLGEAASIEQMRLFDDAITV
jgi:DNA polymerase-4